MACRTRRSAGTPTAPDPCPWCNGPGPVKQAKAEGAGRSTMSMFAVVLISGVHFGSTGDDLASLATRLKSAGSGAMAKARADVGGLRIGGPWTRLATALRKRWADRNLGLDAPGCLIYRDEFGGLYVGPPQVIYVRLGVVVLPRALPAASGTFLSACVAAASIENGGFVTLVGHQAPDQTSGGRRWCHFGDRLCPGCGGAKPAAAGGKEAPCQWPNLAGAADLKWRAVLKLMAVNLAGPDDRGTSSSAIVSDPGADAQQTHKDQPSVAGDSAADSAGIVLVALSDGGCTIDAVVVDWEQRTTTGPEAEPHAVFASNQGDIVMLRYDLSHRGAANPGAEQNYRLHFHLDTPATYRGRTPGWNHYPVA